MKFLYGFRHTVHPPKLYAYFWHTIFAQAAKEDEGEASEGGNSASFI